MEDKFRDKNIDGIAGEPVNSSMPPKNASKSILDRFSANRIVVFSILIIAFSVLIYVINAVYNDDAPKSIKKVGSRIEALENKIKNLENEIKDLEIEIERLNKEIKQKRYSDEKPYFPLFLQTKVNRYSPEQEKGKMNKKINKTQNSALLPMPPKRRTGRSAHVLTN